MFVAIRIPTPLLFRVELKWKLYCRLLLQRKIFLILSSCEVPQLSLTSHNKIISVHNAVMAINLASCLSHSVETFKELQFWVEIVS